MKKREQLAESWIAWAGFLSDVRKAEQKLEFDPEDDRFYRGHADGSWKLLPTLLRDYKGGKVDEVESNLFFEFQARAKELHNLQLEDWDVLFFMRHHRVPTRLLDWTETLGIALYFALEDKPAGQTKPPTKPPCIWVLNPYKLNNDDLVTPRNLGWNNKEESYYDYGELLVDTRKWPWSKAVAIYPQQKPARMSAQRGWFTIHGENRSPINIQKRDAVAKVEIPLEAEAAAREFLRIAGIDRYGIYADLDALGASVVSKNSAHKKPS